MISYNDYAAPYLSATWILGCEQPRLLILFSSIIQKIKLNKQLIGIKDAGLKRTAASEINILLADDETEKDYTGAIDEYFNYEFGALEYRSLRFEDQH